MRVRRKHHHGGGAFALLSSGGSGLVNLCLVCLGALFIGFNLYYFAQRRKLYASSGKGGHNNSYNGVVGGPYNDKPLRSRQWISDSAQPFNLRHSASKSHHLIMVAGHSVTVSGHLEDADRDEADWFLLEYQKHRGLPEAIVSHIRMGLELADKDPDSLLVFSGGETRAYTGPETEGGSYFRVADAMNLWPPDSTVRARTVAEEFATDSFENLMFSICRFREITGVYPTDITVVSFTFKRRRFETMHARALRWPSGNFHYVGVDPPTSSGFNLDEATRGEMQNAAKPFETDPYGCNSPILQDKRAKRNPFSRTPPYELSCPDMKELLHYCGPDIIPRNMIPSSWR